MKTITTTIISIGLFLTVQSAMASNVGKRYPSEKHTIVDRVTGRSITVLTSSQYSDYKPYHTHDTWAADGNWIVFYSNRADNGHQIFAVNELTGDIVQLTDSPGATAINLSRKEMKMFYIRGQQIRQIVELNIGKLIDDSMTGQMKDPTVYERVVVTLPDKPGGQLGLDADETYLYWGTIYRSETTAPRPQYPGDRDRKAYAKFKEEMFAVATRGTSEIYKINVQTGKMDKVLDIPFVMGHLQANPWTPGEIFYCKETGGDADQRIWSVKADGTNNRPIYVEGPNEWVTHETVSSPDEMMFIISGCNPVSREKPTGIAVIHLRNDQTRLLGQTFEGSGSKSLQGFWHCNGSPDGRWAVGDTHAGNIILINRATGEQIPLTMGHPMIPDHAHPIFSRDSKRVLIQSGILTAGKALNLMVVNVP